MYNTYSYVIEIKTLDGNDMIMIFQ